MTVIRWDNIPTPKISEVPPPTWMNFDNYDTTSVSTFTKSFLQVVDTQHYYYMSKTEATEFLYRASVYGVSYITNLFN